MASYWVTFRLERTSTYGIRHEALTQAVAGLGPRWWTEPTSFILFESVASIDEVAEVVKDAIDPAIDMALVGMPDYKSARVIGHLEDNDLFELMPFTKKA